AGPLGPEIARERYFVVERFAKFTRTFTHWSTGSPAAFLAGVKASFRLASSAFASREGQGLPVTTCASFTVPSPPRRTLTTTSPSGWSSQSAEAPTAKYVIVRYSVSSSVRAFVVGS